MPFDETQALAAAQQRRREEKRAIRRRVNGIGAAYLVMTVIMVLWSYPVVGWLSRVDALFGTEWTASLVAFVRDSVTFQLLQVLISSLAFLVPFGILAAVWRLQDAEEWRFSPGTDKAPFWPTVALGMGACGLANWLTALAGDLFEFFGFHYEASLHEVESLNGWAVALSVLSTVFAPALVEEFAMRGVVMKALRPYGDTLAVLVSAALFGMMHGNFEQMPFAFLLGVFIGFAVIRTGSIWCGVLIHGFNNLFSLVLRTSLLVLPRVIGQLFAVLYVPVLCLIGWIGYVTLAKCKAYFTPLGGYEGILTGKERVAAVCSGVMLWLCVAATLYECFFVYAQ